MESLHPEQGRSIYADEGTAAHFLAEQCLREGCDANRFAGRYVLVLPEGPCFRDTAASDEAPEFLVDEEMVGFVQTYIDTVRSYQGADGELLVEKRLSITAITGEEDAYGTSDAVVIREKERELCIIDLKYGTGVQVPAERNEQLMIYALAALAELEFFYEFDRVRLVISQPRVRSAPSEWDCSIEELRTFGQYVRERAGMALAVFKASQPLWDIQAVPGDEQCFFCRAKAHCPNYTKFVSETVTGDFDALTSEDCQPREVPADDRELLGLLYSRLGLVRRWCDALEARVQTQMLNGEHIPGLKLVTGKMGNRAWGNEAQVEALLKSMRLKQDEMYTFKLISPTQAEKMLAKDSPRKWKKLEAHVTRAEGKPIIAQAGDPRPAVTINPVSDDFEGIPESVDDLL